MLEIMSMKTVFMQKETIDPLVYENKLFFRQIYASTQQLSKLHARFLWLRLHGFHAQCAFHVAYAGDLWRGVIISLAYWGGSFKTNNSLDFYFNYKTIDLLFLLAWSPILSAYLQRGNKTECTLDSTTLIQLHLPVLELWQKATYFPLSI